MKLSVIIPFYNVEQYLERCVLSIVDQDIDKNEYEIILINDGSTDGSFDIACRLKGLYSNIHLFSQNNKGQGAARNLGINKAKGDYILFVDSDDYLLPNVFKSMLNIALPSNLDIVVMKAKSMRQDGTFKQVNNAPFKFGEVIDGNYVLKKGYRPASVWAKLFKRNLILKSVEGFLEGIIHEDVDFNLKIFTYAHRVMFVDLCCYVYFWNSNSTDKLMNYDKIVKSIKSDVAIAEDLMLFSKEAHLSEMGSELFKCHANSLITSICYSLFTRYKKLHFTDKKEILQLMKEKKMLPLQGRTNSRNADRMIIVLKYPCLVLLLMKVQSLIRIC